MDGSSSSDNEERRKIMGTVMFIGGILCLVICMAVLCILPKIFSKQRKKLLEEIEHE